MIIFQKFIEIYVKICFLYCSNTYYSLVETYPEQPIPQQQHKRKIMSGEEKGQRDDPNHGGKGGRGRGRDRRNKRNSNVGSGVGVDQSKWRVLDKSYREWLVSSGIAINAEAFNNLSVEQAISARSAYDAADTKNKEQAELTTLLKSLLISNANPYEVISDSHYSAQDSADVRQASMNYYGLPSENFCQVLGQQPEQIKIVNAHVWPRNGTASLPLFDLETSDIHNPRNVLRLHQCIERAFDKRELVFVASAAHDQQLVVKVLSGDLKSNFLKGTRTRFADIDGAPLQIRNPGAFPFRRLLAQHSVLAHRYARTKKWISDDLATEEVNAAARLEHSLDPEAQARIQLLWQKQN